jgi:phosphohistidine phosphatase SixA
MSRQLEQYGINILQLHAQWLQDQGPSYKQQATSAKRQIRMILINKRKKDLTSLKPHDNYRIIKEK